MKFNHSLAQRAVCDFCFLCNVPGIVPWQALVRKELVFNLYLLENEKKVKTHGEEKKEDPSDKFTSYVTTLKPTTTTAEF